MSVDSVYSHGAFAKELGGLPFDLIADFERRMVDAWGVRRTDLEGYDGVPRRTIFILDPEMKVRWTWATSPEQRLPDTEQILAEGRKIAGQGAARATAKTTAKTPAKTSAKTIAKTTAKTIARTTAKKPTKGSKS